MSRRIRAADGVSAVRTARKRKKATGGAEEDELTQIERRLTEGHAVLEFPGVSGRYPCLDFRGLSLQPGHARRPLYVCPDGQVFLEQFSPLYVQARDFLVRIAEPTSRPVYIHEYRLEKNALFAAASMGLTANMILKALQALSKVEVAQSVKDFVTECTVGYGKVKLVLSRGKYYVESQYPAILRRLNENTVIQESRVKPVEDEAFETAEELQETQASMGLQSILDSSSAGGLRRLAAKQAKSGPGTMVYIGDGVVSARKTGEVLSDDSEDDADAAAVVAGAGAGAGQGAGAGVDDLRDDRSSGDEDDALPQLSAATRAMGTVTASEKPVRFQIRSDLKTVDTVKLACLHMDPPFPLMREYDFKVDMLPDLDVRLRHPEILREYQSQSLARMFGNGRARSGLIVLPCGAGKTLVGISAAATIRKSCIVVCPHNTSVKQWIRSFEQFTTLGDRPEGTTGRNPQIVQLTSDSDGMLPPASQACIVFTTYSMVTMDIDGNRRASADNERRLRALRARTWGLMILDETHQLVAKTYKRVLEFAPAHCHLGLTATLVREDGQDKHLSRLIGPKLYEANWRDLTMDGFLAKVRVAEVWCPMTSEYYADYLKASYSQQKLLAVLNPNKCFAMDYLLRKHAKDKTIVFSESVWALDLFARAYGQMALSGATGDVDREAVIRLFRDPMSNVNVLFLSKVGDVALDVPDANVLIQISSHGGARLQEAQRLGRILRKSGRTPGADGYDSYFYTLLSLDTLEMKYSEKRRRYLVAQGYEYNVIRAWPDLDTEENLRNAARFMKTRDAQLHELAKALRTDVDAKETAEDREYKQIEGDATWGGGRRAPARRRDGGIDHLTGAAGVRYLEVNAGMDTAMTKEARAKRRQQARARKKAAAADKLRRGLGIALVPAKAKPKPAY